MNFRLSLIHISNAYLEAELEVCKMVQKVQDRISEAIRIGVPEI